MADLAEERWGVIVGRASTAVWRLGVRGLRSVDSKSLGVRTELPLLIGPGDLEELPLLMDPGDLG